MKEKHQFSKPIATAIAIATLTFGIGCSPTEESLADDNSSQAGRRIAVAYMSPTEGNSVEGTVTFFEEAAGIRVVADLRGLTANTEHGFHIHENGDCSAPDAISAGGHFNPTGHPHAGPGSDERHVGDLGNLKTTNSGGAMHVVLDDKLSFDGDTSIIGRGVIVHAGKDDLTSQPSGAAGPRLACGVIEWTEM